MGCCSQKDADGDGGFKSSKFEKGGKNKAKGSKPEK